MLQTIIIVVVVVIAALLIFAATKPNTFRVERATSIKAPAEKIFAAINDLHGWSAWSPWEHLDPNMQRTFSGTASGVGAIYEWNGNNKVGKGRMEIIESVPASKILIKLDFLKPFEGHNKAEFTLTAHGDVTDVSWAMYGPQPFIGKMMGIFLNCDKMIGMQFETGLANLKAAAEK